MAVCSHEEGNDLGKSNAGAVAWSGTAESSKRRSLCAVTTAAERVGADCALQQEPPTDATTVGAPSVSQG